MTFVNWLTEFGITDSLDIAFMSLIIYSVFVWFKKTRAAFVLTGIIIISGVYLIAREFNLFLTAAVFQGFFAVILVAVVVIFQEELRHFFEQVAVWSLERRLSTREFRLLSHPEVETLMRTLNDFAREKTGALVVLRGKDLIMRHLNGGVELQGKLSEPLLKSIFDSHSMGHDGAVVIERGIVTRFACHLPLSKNFKSIGHTGTRHAAALGLSELTDALCLVVSEERGTISAARNGEIHPVKDTEELSLVLHRFYQDITPGKATKLWQDFFKKNSREKIIALSMTLALWFVLVHGSKLVTKTYTVPVEYSVLPSTLTVTKIFPTEVDVAFSGPRRAFYSLNKKKIKVFVKLWNLKEGTKTIKLSRSELSFPKDIALETIEPPAIEVHLKKSP